MPGEELLRDFTIVFAASMPILFLFRKLRLPTILGFLATGALLGPHALSWVKDTQHVEAMADVGVILILFFVGLEFPLEKLARLGKPAAIAGFLQMALCVAAIFAAHTLGGDDWRSALFAGFLVALSSTAVVLPILAARDELATPHARRFLGVSLFQDLAVVPLVLLLPALAGGGGGPGTAIAVAKRAGLAIGGLALLVTLARFVVPHILSAIARLGSREGFTGAVIVLVLLMVSLATRGGVSPAMGAFAAGMVLGESEYLHDVVAALSPFRDLLSSLFFVSIGMLLDPRLLLASPLGVLAAIAFVTLLKTSTAFLALRLAHAPPRTAARAALALAAVGEFSFVLARAGQPLGLLEPENAELFVAVAVGTLALAPALIAAGPHLASLLPDRPETDVLDEEKTPPLARHVIVAGYGLNGQNVARVLSVTHIPHIVLDIEPERVAAAREAGSRALRADATGAEALEAAGVTRAMALVVATSDPDATRRTVLLARAKNPTLRILVRTRYLREVDALRAAGADEVIPEEFETSIEIVARILRVFHLPGNVVAAQIRLLRDEAYRRLRETTGRRDEGRRLAAFVAAGTTELFLVLPDTCADGKTLAELHLAEDHVTVPALLRDSIPFAPPPHDMRVQAGDTLLLVGAHEDLARAMTKLEEGSAS